MTYFRLIGYELKKLFSFTSVKLILVLLLALNLFFTYSYIRDRNKYNVNESLEYIYEMHQTNPDYYELEYERILDDWYHRETFEPSRQYSPGKANDRTLFLTVEFFLQADTDYHEALALTLSQAQAIRDNLSERPISYSYRYQEELIRKYQYLNETVTIQNEPVYGWKEYFLYDAEIIFVLIAVAACALVIALNDKTIGFYSIQATCARGRKSTAAAKFAAMVIVCMGVSLVFSISTLTMVSSVYGLSDAGNAIQAVFQEVRASLVEKVELMRLNPFPVSIAGFLCIFFSFKAFVAVMFGAVVMVFAILLGSRLLGGLAGVAFAAFQSWLSHADILLTGQWKYLSFFSVYAAGSFWTRYRSVNIFGYSIDLVIVFLVLFLFIMAVAFAVCLTTASRKSSPRIMRMGKSFLLKDKESSARIPRPMGKPFRGSFSLLGYEWYKNGWLLVFLVFLLAAKCFISAGYYQFKDTSYNRLYQQYIAEIGGEYSDEKAEYLQKEYDSAQAVVACYSEIREAYISHEIDKEAFEAYLKEHNVAQAKIPVLKDLTERSSYLKELLVQKGIRASYVFDTGFEKYTGQGVDWLLILFVCLFCCNSLIVEFGRTSSKGSIYELVQSTPLGRMHLYGKKILSNVIVVTIAYWIFFAVDFIAWRENWTLPSSGDLLVSLPAYAQTSENLTFGGYCTLICVSGFLGVLLMSLLCVSVTLLLKDMILIYAVQTMIWVAPYFMQSIGMSFCNYFDLTKLTDTNSLFAVSYSSWWKETEVFGWFSVFFVLCAILTAGLFILSVRQIRKGLRG